MKTLTGTLTVIAALILLATVVAPAQNASSGQIRYDSDINSGEAGVAVVLAQPRTSRPVTPSPAPTPPTPATPTPPTLPTSVSVDLVSNDLVRSLSFRSRPGSAGMVLVIPSEKTSTEDLIKINEDMNVMSRIFGKNLEENRITTARGSMFFSRGDTYGTLLGSSRGGIQSMYLQGFGALFMLKVDFPLSPSPDVQQEEKETQKAERGDPVWQETRQEMFEPGKAVRNRRADRPESKYDAEKVENLKATLIKSLKHAANIRCLKQDESVILTITGGGESAGTKISAINVTGNNQVIVEEKSADGKSTMRIVNGTELDDIGMSSPAVLVIRTKKSDIDEFAKGDLDFDKFRQRIQLLTYPLLGTADGGHRDSFSPFIQFRSTGSSNTSY